MTPGRHALARRSLIAALSWALLAGPATAHAQSSCTPLAPPAARTQPWAPPLNRPVTLSVRDISLRDALARVAAAARVRLSYSADLLPLDRRVCASPRSVPFGEALATLLRGTAVQPTVADVDHVVLVPSTDPSLPAPDSATWSGVTVLDRVVVTGSAAGTAQRPLSIALDVVDGARLRQSGTVTLAEALNAAVPGMWVWSQSPSSLLSRYASVRGASSFGLTYPKVYIDGVEVANARLVSRLNPETIERVEVIRGPQGAALYGADAISGVVNIVTRHESVDSGSPLIRLHSGVGAARSDFVPNAAVAQDHSISLRTGSVSRSLGVDLSAGSTGAFIPDAYSRRFMGSANARLVGERTITTVTTRFDAERAGAAVSPLLKSALGDDVLRSAAPPGRPSPASQSVQQFTVGMGSNFAQNDRWTHSLVLGVDGDRLDGVPDDDLPLPFVADSSQPLSSGHAIRGTLRASSEGRFDLSGQVAATVILSAEHSTLRQESATGGGPSVSWSGELVPAGSPVVDWQRNTGAVAQGSVSLRSHLYLSGGVRMERNSLVGGSSTISALPMLGATAVFGDDEVTLKLRTAYGKGIRPARTSVRQASWASYRAQLRSLGLGPEEQRGVESGVDLILGHLLTLQVTRFDQLASGLIQRVAIGQTPPPGETPAAAPPGGDPARPGAPGRRRMLYALQNVGEISNRGWELQGSAELGQLSLSGSLSLVDSRVHGVGSTYTGDLRVGDRMLAVPARSGALTALWSAPTWSASLTTSRAASWINYDRLGLAQAAASASTPASGLMGPQLRNYWRTYQGNTHLGATVARDLTRQVSLLLTGENLLDRQSGEPDDVTIVPGRALSVGLRAAF